MIVRQAEYLIRWRYYGPTDDQWIGSDDLDCPALVKAFDDREMQALRSELTSLKNELNELKFRNDRDINKITDKVNEHSSTLGLVCASINELVRLVMRITIYNNNV